MSVSFRWGICFVRRFSGGYIFVWDSQNSDWTSRNSSKQRMSYNLNKIADSWSSDRFCSEHIMFNSGLALYKLCTYSWHMNGSDRRRSPEFVWHQSESNWYSIHEYKKGRTMKYVFYFWLLSGKITNSLIVRYGWAGSVSSYWPILLCMSVHGQQILIKLIIQGRKHFPFFPVTFFRMRWRSSNLHLHLAVIQSASQGQECLYLIPVCVNGKSFQYVRTCPTLGINYKR